MIHIKHFPNPCLNTNTSTTQSGAILIEDAFQLPIPSLSHSPLFDNVLESRYSFRAISAPSIEELSGLLKLSCAIRASKDSEFGQIQSRTSPSAGGLHAFDILTCGTNGLENLALYDPNYHTLGRISGVTKLDLRKYEDKMQELFPNSKCGSIILLANREKYSAKYGNWESLALRDSGAFLGIMHLCAARLGLKFCIGGVLGNEISEINALKLYNRMAVGVAIFGR